METVTEQNPVPLTPPTSRMRPGTDWARIGHSSCDPPRPWAVSLPGAPFRAGLLPERKAPAAAVFWGPHTRGDGFRFGQR